MPDIYLCGHGRWDTIGRGDPYTTLPKSTTLSFYTPMGRYLAPGNAYATITNDTTQGGMVLDEYQRIREFRIAPNVTLSPLVAGRDDEAIRLFTNAANAGKQIHRVNAATSLTALLALLGGNNLHWMACQPRLGDVVVDDGGFNDDYIPDWGMYGGIPPHLRGK